MIEDMMSMDSEEGQDTIHKGESTSNLHGQAQDEEMIYFGDEIFFKAESIGSMKYIHSDGFYPSCLKCVDFAETPSDQIDIYGAIFEITNPQFFFFGNLNNSSGSGKFGELSQTLQSTSAKVAVTSAVAGSSNTTSSTSGSGMNSMQQSQSMMSSMKDRNGSGAVDLNELSKGNRDDSGSGSGDSGFNGGVDEFGGEDSRVALTFNSNFVLRHKRSQKFLSLIEEDLEHYSLVLSSNPSLFKISPCFKSQIVQSKSVCYMQFIYLEGVQQSQNASSNNNNKSIYLVKDEIKARDEKSITVVGNGNTQTFGTSSGGDLGSILESQVLREPAASTQTTAAVVNSRFANYASFFGDFYFSPNQKTRFHIDRFHESNSLHSGGISSTTSTSQMLSSTSNNPTNAGDIGSDEQSDSVEEFVRFGDVIKLFHIETDAFMQYSDETLFGKPEEQATGITTVDEVGKENGKVTVHFSKPSSDADFNESHTLWRIMNPKNIFDGGCVRWTQAIVLKCLTRNLYLHVKDKSAVSSGRSQVILRNSFVGEESTSSYFHLCEELGALNNGSSDLSEMRQQASHQNHVRYNSLFRLVHSATSFTLSAKFSNELSDLNPEAVTTTTSTNSKNQQDEGRALKKQSSMTESIVDRSMMSKYQALQQRKIFSEESQANESTTATTTTAADMSNNTSIPVQISNPIILKQEYCEGDITRFQTVPTDEVIENNYLASTLDLMSAAIPLILQYIRLSEDTAKKMTMTQKLNSAGTTAPPPNAQHTNNNNNQGTFQFSNPYFNEFIALLQLAIEHQIKFLLDIESTMKVKFDDSIFRRHKVNSEKQDRAQKLGVLEFSVNLLKSIWSHSSEERIFEILKETKRINLEEARNSSASARKTKASSLGRRRTSQIQSFKSKVDQKDEEIQLYRTFQRISRLIYFLIITLCRNNQFNSLSTFSYFTFFKNHLGYSIGATRTILSILKNNEKLLSILHSKNYTDLSEIKTTISRTLSRFKVSQFGVGSSSISSLKIADVAATASASQKRGMAEKKMTLIHIFFKKYAQMFTQSHTYWTNFVKVMNIMCTCKEKALNINQLVIGNELLTNAQHQHLFITLECTNDLIYLTVLERRFELSDFLKVEQSQKPKATGLSTSYDFLLKQLELYSNLCVGRNYQNKGLLEKRITASALIKYITNEEITTELRALLLNLLINLHFDSCPRKEIQRPCFTKTINISSLPGQIGLSTESSFSLNSSAYGYATTQQLNRPLLQNNRRIPIPLSASQLQQRPVVEKQQQMEKPKKDQGDSIQSISGATTFKGFLSKDSMEGMKEIKIFIVDYLSRSIFSKPGQIKSDMLSYNVVKLARLMIAFNCFDSTEQQFTQVVESFLIILQTENKSSLNEKFKNVFLNDPDQIKQKYHREQCQLKILQEVLHSLLYYQQIEVDGNLRNLLNFYEDALLVSTNSNNNESNSKSDAHLNGLIKNSLVEYLPRLQSLKPATNKEDSNSVGVAIGVTSANNIGSNNSNSNSHSNNNNRNSGMSRSASSRNGSQMSSQSWSSQSSSSSMDQRRLSDAYLFKGFDEIIVDNSFFNILLKNFVSVGQSDLQTSHLILKILFSNFSQRKNTIQAIKKLQIISSKTEIAVFNYLKSLSVQLGFVAEMQELWFTGDSQFSQQSAFEEINELMDQLSLAFFSQSELKVDSTNGGEESVSFDITSVSTEGIEVIIANTSANIERQQMMKNLDIHTHILNILKEGNMLLAGLQKKNGVVVGGSSMELIQRLYRSCYNFLYLFVQGNPANQKILAQSLDDLLMNIGDKDCGQYRVLAESVKDNRKIGESLTHEFLSQYITSLFKSGMNDNANLHSLLFFENIIFDHGQPSFWNIDKFVKSLFDTNSFVCFFGLMSPIESSILAATTVKQAASSPHQFEFDIPNTKQSKKCMRIEDLPYVYHKQVLSISNDVLKHSLDPTNFRYFLSKIISLSYAFQLLSTNDVFDVAVNDDDSILFSYFKPTLMEFIRQVWLNNEKNSAKLNRNPFLVQFLKQETAKFTSLKPSQIAAFRDAMNAESSKQKYEGILFSGSRVISGSTGNVSESINNSEENKEDDDEEESDLLLSNSEEEEEQIMSSKQRNLVSRKKKKKQAKKEPKYEFQFMEKAVVEVQTDYVQYVFKYLLPFVLDTFKCFIGFDQQQNNVNTRSDYRAFADFAKEFVEFCQIELTKEIFVSSIQIIAPALKEFEEIFKESLTFTFDYEAEVKKFEDRGAMSLNPRLGVIGAYGVLDNRVHAIMNSTEVSSHRTARISLALLSSEQVRVDIVRQERSQLVRALREGNRTNNNLSTQNILKKLVNFVKNAVDELENEEGIIKSDDEVLEDTVELLCELLDSCTREEERVYMQNFLNSNGIIGVMIKFFCIKCSEANVVFGKFVNLGIRLISSSAGGANAQIQETFYANLLAAPNSESFFMKVEQLIKEEIHFQAFQNKNVQQKIVAETKSLSFSYSIHDKFSIQTLLQFIQLLVSNSFSKLQRYLHFQVKSKVNHNILALLVDLLEAYIGGRNYMSGGGGGDSGQFGFVTDANRCEKTLMTLETLILCIQGPTVENQIELADSKFLDIATYILRLNDSFDQFMSLSKSASEEEGDNRNGSSENEGGGEESNNSDPLVAQHSNSSRSKVVSQFQMKLTMRQRDLVRQLNHASPSYANRLQSLFKRGNPKNYGVWMLSQIKNKCISCLESLTDGENKAITKRIMSTIPPSILKTNLAWIYEKYETLFEKVEYYDYELFEIKEVMQVFSELKSCEKSVVLQRSLRESFIIDSGFKMFKLLRFMLAQMSNNEVEIVYNEIAKSQAQILHKQSKKNIFYQVLGLLQDIGKIFLQLYIYLKKTESLNKRLKNQNSVRGGASSGRNGGSGVASSTSSAQNLEKMKMKAIKFFSKYSGQIEIVSNDKLVRVSFPKYPHCFSLTNSLKYKVTEKIDLYSPHSKVESIAEQASAFIERLKFEQMFKAKLENNNMIAILANNLDLWKNLSFIVSILQNILIVFYQTRSNVQSIFYFHFIGTNNEFQLTFQIFQIWLASLVFFFFLLKKVPLINKKVEDIIASIEQEKFSINEHSMYQNKAKINYRTKLRNFKIKAWLFINDGELGYFLIYFTLALAGMFNEFFLALLLFDIFWRFPVLQNIILAVWRPRRQILLTMFLFLICTYFFSLTAFYFFADRFDHLCDNLLTCFSVMFDYMYKNDGGITSKFAPNGSDDFVNYYGLDYQLDWGSLWDFMYFFIIITLLFSIVSGIIIDTFGLLRDEEDQKKRNKRDFCLMCSIERGTIDKLSISSQGFQHHIDVEHNVWNYIFFISYLQEKNRNYFLGIEQEIYNKLQKKEISWFPLNRSMSVNQNQEQNEELENIQKKISSLESKFTNVLDALLKSSKMTTQRIAKIDASQTQQLSLLQQSQQQQQKVGYSVDATSSQSPLRPKPRKIKRAGTSYIPSNLSRKLSDQVIEEEEIKPVSTNSSNSTQQQMKGPNALTSLINKQCDSD